MAERDRGSRRHRLRTAVLSRLAGLLHRARRAGRRSPAGPERHAPRPAAVPEPAEPPGRAVLDAGPPAPEELEALVAAALNTPRPPVAPPSAAGTAETPPASDACDPEPPSGPVDVGRRAAHDACAARAARDARLAREAHAQGRAHGPYASVVHGFIVTPDGEPLHSVTVTLLARGGRRLDRVSSLADGSYILAAPAPGVYVLAATAPGHAARARHIMLGDGPLTYDLELVETVGGGVRTR
ncbi:carboxypeptidase-like regulatory domain-containing protein [Streptomyces typhae]|uniref:carboxypeptidase-like regulatory domain-containing protein n=1 Tax=Streptomyces typhae TaxID=2681492 RepID=UPI001FE9491A|nr:carboxypeptidase-like regulatory domain-containing protein [Streptomyces typhae]